MIVITGANGTLGRLVTERLLDTVPAAEVGVSVRDPEQAAALAERGVRVRRGDFAEPATLANAFEGATQVLVVSAGALGDTAVHALTGTDLDDISPTLTAPEAIDMAGVAEIASELLGRPLRRTTVSDEDYRAVMVASGAPEAAADLMVGMFRASRRGEFAAVDPTLGRLLGRRPVKVGEVLQAALAPEPAQP